MTKTLSFAQERQKLIDNWPENKEERKRQIRKLYETLCLESDAEVAQLKSLGCSSGDIWNMGNRKSRKNIGRIVEEVEKSKK